jgi:acetyl-CoA carboxylase biotin carboxyl carrier protein
MDLEYVTKLIELLSESTIDEIEIEEEGKRIRVARSRALPQQAQYHVPGYAVPPPQAPAAIPAPAAAAPIVASKLHEVKSPIVGTFYRAPAPDAAPFADVGTMVSAGTVLCIVEAMKLMNEIESDVAGKVVKVMVENGQPIEYDQVLFLIEPA